MRQRSIQYCTGTRRYPYYGTRNSAFAPAFVLGERCVQLLLTAVVNNPNTSDAISTIIRSTRPNAGVVQHCASASLPFYSRAEFCSHTDSTPSPALLGCGPIPLLTDKSTFFQWMRHNFPSFSRICCSSTHVHQYDDH